MSSSNQQEKVKHHIPTPKASLHPDRWTYFHSPALASSEHLLHHSAQHLQDCRNYKVTQVFMLKIRTHYTFNKYSINAYYYTD